MFLIFISKLIEVRAHDVKLYVRVWNDIDTIKLQCAYNEFTSAHISCLCSTVSRVLLRSLITLVETRYRQNWTMLH